MDIYKASEITKKHRELEIQMCELFETATDIDKLPLSEFEEFYCDFVGMAVENFPSLLD